MNEGKGRNIVTPSGRNSLWPTSLLLPERPPKLIYLDLNHWIELSKAYSGHQDGAKHQSILDACLAAVKDRKAVFPLSEHIYTEIGKITNFRQRRNLREIIEQVCGYMVLTSLAVVATHEVEALLDEKVGSNPTPINPTDYLNWGAARAFGMAGGIRVKSAAGDDVTDQARHLYRYGPHAFDAVLLEAELQFDRKMIEGPAPDEELRFRAFGWNPEVQQSGYEQKALDELEQAQRLNDHDPVWRHRRIRDVITAREAIVEIRDIVAEGLEARGPGADDRFYSVTPEEFRSAYNAMPSFDVGVTLKSSLHRDRNYKWRNNDIYDIRGLALTIPYCDVIVTDRSMCSHVERHHLLEHYDTVVIPTLAELPDYI